MHQLSSPHRRIRLRDLPTAVQGTDIERFEFQSCSSDWEQCQPNDLFVAITRGDGDGHEEAHLAIENGATAILAERLLPVDVPVFVTSDTREAFGHICHQLSGTPSKDLQTIGITGTSGKSTTAGMIHEILLEAGRSSLLADADEDEFESTPRRGEQPCTSPQIAVRLSDAVACGYDHALLELPSSELASRLWSGTELDVAVLTSIAADFGDQHGTPENYQRAMERVLDLLKESGLVIVNADQPKLRELLDRLPFPALTYGIKQEAEIMGEVIEDCLTEQTVMIHAGYESTPVRLRRPGQHFLSNALAATTVALAQGIELPTIQRGLENYEPTEPQIEPVKQSATAAQVFVDSAVYPDRLRSALRALYRHKTGKIWCIAEISPRLSGEHRASMGSLLERYAHGAAISVSPDLADEGFEAIHDVMDGYERVGRDMVIPHVEQALEWALDQAKAGDLILIAGEMESCEHLIERLEEHVSSHERESQRDEDEPVILRLDDYRPRD